MKLRTYSELISAKNTQTGRQTGRDVVYGVMHLLREMESNQLAAIL